MRKLKVITEQDRTVLKRKIIIGGTVAVGAGLYVLHRKKLMALGVEAREAIEMTMNNSFTDGVKYGLQLAKDVGIGAAEASEYAFGAFDKADRAALMHTTVAG